MASSDNEITLNSVPIEVLVNNVFKFFEFRDWLKYLVPVCKKWRQAAVESHQEKLIRLDLSNLAKSQKKFKIIFNIRCLLSYYRITALILTGSGISVYELASIINASPKLKTVTFRPPCTSFTMFHFETDKLPFTDHGNYDPEVKMNHVTTVKVPCECSSLLCMFPNAEKISLCDDWRSFEYASTCVTEVEVSAYYQGDDWQTSVLDLKRKNFPNMKKLYMVINERAENFQNLVDNAKNLGVEVICRVPIDLDQESIQQNCPFLYDTVSFPSNLEGNYWNIDDEQFMRRCYKNKTLPFWFSVKFQIEHLQNGKELAIDTLKTAHPLSLESFTDSNVVNACGKVLSILSPQRILQEVGRDKLRIILNGWNHSTVLYNFLQTFNNRFLQPTFDLLEFSDIIETQTLQRLHNDILNYWGVNRLGHIAPIVRQIDEVLKERVNGSRSLPVEIIFKKFSLGNYGEIPAIIQPFNIDINQEYNANGHTLLSLGIAKSSPSKIKTALQLGIDINKPDKMGRTPLVYAVSCSDIDTIQLLLQRGSDPNITGDTLPPLHMTLIEHDDRSFDIMNALLDYGADVNKPYVAVGQTIYPIYIAMNWCSSENVQIVRQLISQGANVNVTDQNGNTLLHMIRHKGELNTEIFSLLGKYIDVNSANKLGRTPLHHAIMNQSEFLSSIIRIGADVNQCDMFGWTSLMMAMKFSCTKETLNPLLATNKVNFKARDKNGQSFITYLVKHSSWLEMQRIFISEPYDRMCQHYLTEDNIQFITDECKKLISEWKDLSKAFKIITCHITLTKFLIEQVGLDVNHSDVLGNTLLSCMKLTNDSNNVIEYLIAKGAKLHWEQDPLLMKEIFKAPVFRWQSYQKMKLLMKYGAKPTEANQNGVSLMDIDPEFRSKLEQDLQPDFFNYCPQIYLKELLSLRKDKEITRI